jgi:hypothetical protein
MGIFYYVKSIALSEDLPGVEREGGFEKAGDFYDIADRGYVQVCMITVNVTRLYNSAVSATKVKNASSVCGRISSKVGIPSNKESRIISHYYLNIIMTCYQCN